MDNTSFFKFNFVDREETKKLINSFLNNETDSNVLWLNGSHGVGKSFLLNNIKNFAKCPKTIYVELHAEDSEPNCLFELLKNIGDSTKIPLLKFFKKNYMEIINILKSAVLFTTKQITNIDLTDLVDLLFDASKLFVCKKNDEKEQQNAVKMLTCYLDEILLNSDLLIIIDNFSLCDQKSLPIIFDIILSYQKKQRTSDNKIFFILTTTSNVNNNIISKEIKEKIPNCRTEISDFNKAEYFYNILSHIFNISMANTNEIFELCHGNPQRLKDFIHKLYDENGIELENGNKPTINSNILNELIYKGTTDIDIKELSPSKRIILSLMVFFGKSMTSELIIEMTAFVLSDFSLYPKVDRNDISKAVFDLSNENIIIIYYSYGHTFLKIEHDIKFDNIKYQLEKEPFKEQINKSIFSFLNSFGSKYLNNVLSEDELEDSIAYHAYMAKIANWKTLNLDLAIKKYRKGLYQKSKNIIDRIYIYISELDCKSQFLIAECYFRTGDYLEARKILQYLYQYESDKFTFETYCLFAKVENILMNKQFAFELADKAYNFPNTTETMKLKAICIKQQTMVNLKSQRSYAKKIFDNVKNTIAADTKSTLEYGNFLISTVEYYRGDKAQIDLKEAENIALHYDDQFLLSTIYFSMGFDDFWEGEFSKSKDELLKSYKILKRISQHETAYVLNNLASHFMIENDIDSAINYLYRALLWAQSDYAQIVIKTQLMVCFSLLLDDYSLKLADEIKVQMKKILLNDVSAYIKFNYNLSFVYYKLDMISESNQYLLDVINVSENVNPQSLPHTWIKEINKNSNDWLQIHLNDFNNKYIDKRFDPWLLTLNHY